MLPSLDLVLLVQHVLHLQFNGLRQRRPAVLQDLLQDLPGSPGLRQAVEALQRRVLGERQNRDEVVQQVRALLQGEHRRVVHVAQGADRRNSGLVPVPRLVPLEEVEHHVHGLHPRLVTLLGLQQGADGRQGGGAVYLLQQPYGLQHVPREGETEGRKLGGRAAELHAGLVQVGRLVLTVQQAGQALHRVQQHVLLPLGLQGCHVEGAD
mmetsp:Transcript_14655/g.42704  ORF Transcript_14655/g.42704 Transcript_14655/m.42704 type:complete len:209 (-) Transcript_14655:595-1221(-)